MESHATPSPAVAEPTFGPYTPTPSAPVAPPDDAAAPWPRPALWAFRFFCVATVVQLFPFPLDMLLGPAYGPVLGWWDAMWLSIAAWVGAHVLHTAAPAVPHPNGAGDKTVYWVMHACVLAVGVVGAVVWSALSRRRAHPVALDRLRTLLRLFVGVDMLGYGLAKIVPTQFPSPALFRYVEPYGEFSPMSVLWVMMGHSPAYNVFCGGAEALGAVLLFWRRTTLLGALILVGALANVMALNYTFDVSVKLHSTELMVWTLFLLLPDVRRVFDAVVLQRAVPARETAATGVGPRERRVRSVLTPLFLLVALAMLGMQERETWQMQHARGNRWAGIYDVASFVRNGTPLAPLTTDPVRWRRLVVERRSRVTVQVMSDSLRRFRLTSDSTERRLAFTSMADSTLAARLDVVRADAAGMELAGTFGADSLRLVLRRVDPAQFTLRRRGFHWVQDDNFQR